MNVNQIFCDMGSFVQGEVAGPRSVYLFFTIDELSKMDVPHTQMIGWNGEKFTPPEVLNWTAKAAIFLPGGESLFVGRNGDFVLRSEEKRREGRIHDLKGQVRSGRLIDGLPIVVGMNRQVSCWNGEAWEPLTSGLPSGEGAVSGFESIAGFSRDEIYVTGWDGEIWRFDGTKWNPVQSPVSALIVDSCADSETIWACGRNGLFLRGRGDAWEVVDLKLPHIDFWSVASFKGRVYLASYDGLFAYLDGDVKRVEFEDDVRTFYDLTSSSESLWSIGAKDVMCFDGQTWTRVV